MGRENYQLGFGRVYSWNDKTTSTVHPGTTKPKFKANSTNSNIKGQTPNEIQATTTVKYNVFIMPTTKFKQHDNVLISFTIWNQPIAQYRTQDFCR